MPIGSGAPDAARPPPTGSRDAAQDPSPDAALDAKPDATLPDAGPAGCAPERCPQPGAPIPHYGFSVPRACCSDPHVPLERDHAGSGRCGVAIVDDSGELIECAVIEQGEVDEACRDTVIDGMLIEGCRRSEGSCGHDGGIYGCHRIFRRRWDVDVEAAGVANPFVCARDAQPCSQNAECCTYTHGSGVCAEPSWNDGGSICVDPEDAPDSLD